jgi:hypothetical protein
MHLGLSHASQQLPLQAATHTHHIHRLLYKLRQSYDIADKKNPKNKNLKGTFVSVSPPQKKNYKD